MPHRHVFDEDLELGEPAWLSEIDDACLHNTLLETLVARRMAIKEGALDHPRALKIWLAGSKTLEQIKYGRYSGPIACTKAADALRKFQQAIDYFYPVTLLRRRDV